MRGKYPYFARLTSLPDGQTPKTAYRDFPKPLGKPNFSERQRLPEVDRNRGTRAGREPVALVSKRVVSLAKLETNPGPLPKENPFFMSNQNPFAFFTPIQSPTACMRL